MSDQPLRIWIDLENSPHVLFFAPIADELRRRGHQVCITARDFCNTVSLARERGMDVRVLGKGYDKARNIPLKVAWIFIRAGQLWAHAIKSNYSVAVSHGSRTQALAARAARVPIVGFQDYEKNDLRVFKNAAKFLIPDAVPVDAFVDAGVGRDALMTYPGLKEDVYLAGYEPTVDVRSQLGISPDAVLVSLRPVAEQAHYVHGRDRAVQDLLIERVAAQPGAHLVVLPRTTTQRDRMIALDEEHENITVVRDVVDGPSLICASDLVVSGGGTMVREAAALGVPALSIFEGVLGYLDEALVKDGRLTVVQSEAELESAFPIARRGDRRQPTAAAEALDQMVDAIVEAGRQR